MVGIQGAARLQGRRLHCPTKALRSRTSQRLGNRLAKPMGLKLVELTGDNTPDTRTIQDADIIVTTPEKWDGISCSWQTRGVRRSGAGYHR